MKTEHRYFAKVRGCGLNEVSEILAATEHEAAHQEARDRFSDRLIAVMNHEVDADTGRPLTIDELNKRQA